MKPSQGKQSGFSLMEITVVMAITTIVMLIALNMIDEASTVGRFVESRNDLTLSAQRPLNYMQKDILQARVVFGEDTLGTALRQKIETSIAAATNPLTAAESLLPILDPTGTFVPDTGGNRKVGNALLIARQLSPVAVDLAADGTYPALVFTADRYEFVYFYLTRDTSQQFATGGRIDTIAYFRSVIYADYNQLTSGVANLSTLQKTNLSTALRSTAAGAPNLQIAWDPSAATIATSFFTIDNNLTFPVGSVIANPTIARASGGTLIPGLKGGRIAGKMVYTVAYRAGTTKPGTAFPISTKAQPVPLYAEVTTSLPLDCGFEVKVIGPPGSRQVMTRLVTYGQFGIKKYDSQQAFVITSFVR
jgi:prepilin-type N-terminal cleavage/methylation domain-containing protein